MNSKELDLSMLKPGCTIIFSTNDEKLRGELLLVGKDWFEIHELEDLTGKTDRTGCKQMYYAPEIRSLSLVMDEIGEECLAKYREAGQKVELQVRGPPPIMSIDTKEINRQLRSVQVIVQYDASYHRAIADLKAQLAIGLFIEPQCGRFAKSDIFTIATSQNVYLFDMLAIGKIKKEFADIFVNREPIKAIHFGSNINDHFKNRQGIDLNGIFDTFVAYCLTKGTKQPKTLVDTIAEVMEMPKSYFDYESTGKFQERRRLFRPLKRPSIEYLAKRAIYVLRLYHQLLHGRMLDNFYRQCEKFATVYSDDEDFLEVGNKMKVSTQYGYEHIGNDDWKATLEQDMEKLSIE